MYGFIMKKIRLCLQMGASAQYPEAVRYRSAGQDLLMRRAASIAINLFYDTGGFPVSCSGGTQAYSGTDKAYIHKGLANNTTYYYRLCAKDNAGNISAGVTASATPSLSSGPDLTGTWSSLVQTCRNSGKSVKCKIKGKLAVQNSGQQEAKTSFVRYYLSDNSDFESGDAFLKQVSTGKNQSRKKQKHVH